MLLIALWLAASSLASWAFVKGAGDASAQGQEEESE